MDKCCNLKNDGGATLSSTPMTTGKYMEIARSIITIHPTSVINIPVRSALISFNSERKPRTKLIHDRYLSWYIEKAKNKGMMLSSQIWITDINLQLKTFQYIGECRHASKSFTNVYYIQYWKVNIRAGRDEHKLTPDIKKLQHAIDWLRKDHCSVWLKCLGRGGTARGDLTVNHVG